MRDALLQPRITRRSALQMAGAAALPALIKPARAAEPSTIRVAFAIQPATLDPQKMRVGGVDYNYLQLLQPADSAGPAASGSAGPGNQLGGDRGSQDLDISPASGS